ncbi:MAG: hypothetical protein HY646_18795 [Acidobacteria bacterium]|nr:hypothetical protein [Acidobacteriota bacterium]
MTEPSLDFPNHSVGQQAGKWGVLTYSLRIVSVGDQHCTDLAQRPFQQFSPLFVASKKGWGIPVLPRPAIEISASEIQPFWMLRQTDRDTTR